MKCKVTWPAGRRSLTAYGAFVGGEPRELNLDEDEQRYLKRKGFTVQKHAPKAPEHNPAAREADNERSE